MHADFVSQAMYIPDHFSVFIDDHSRSEVFSAVNIFTSLFLHVREPLYASLGMT